MSLEHIFNALIFGLILSFFVTVFLPPEKENRAGKKLWGGKADLEKILCFLAMSLLLALGQCFSFLQGYLFYLYVLMAYVFMAISLRLWSKQGYLACLQRGLSLFLITESLLLVMTHLSQKMYGEDVLRSSFNVRNILALGGYILISYLCIKLLRRFYPRRVRSSRRTLLLCYLSVVPYLFVRQITLWLPVEVDQVTFAIVLTVAVSAALSILFSVNLEMLLEAEEGRRQMLLQMERQKQHYVQKKSSVESVRRQYHDMKNLLLYLEKGPSRENVSAHLGKILSSMESFESVLDTGNEAVDIILGEKLEVCKKKSIPCTVMVDGKALSLVGQLDLVTILGNAMDNAMEGCMMVAEDQRFIRVRTAQNPGFVILYIENSCEESIALKQGSLPKTTKGDQENHGYGIQNLIAAVKKYGGEVRIEAKEGMFSLTILWKKQEGSEG